MCLFVYVLFVFMCFTCDLRESGQHAAGNRHPGTLLVTTLGKKHHTRTVEPGTVTSVLKPPDKLVVHYLLYGMCTPADFS